ncbi:DUF4296 domain-containing protein [Psychroserpens sp. MEBiC05023]
MKRILICVLVVLCFGCDSSKKPKKPDDLIPKDQMVNILYDVFILNAAKGANKKVLEDKGIFPEDFIFEKYKIDSLQFAKSNEYYGFFVEDYESIVDRVEKRIENDRVKYKALADQEEKDKQRKRDSIRALSDSIKVKKTKKLDKQEKVDYKDYRDVDTSSK